MRSWGRLLRREQQEADLNKELRFHIEERIADFRRSGVSEEEARRKGRQEFGGMEQVKDDCRDARRTRGDTRLKLVPFARSVGRTILQVSANPLCRRRF